MTNLHFPASLTEEEENLKQALIRLKKKKKQLQAFKTASQNQEKSQESHSKASSKQAPVTTPHSSAKATEAAKKLVQSGRIKVAELKVNSGFKRSKNFEKKLKDTGEKTSATPVGFQPFQQSFSGGEEDDDKPPSNKRMKGLGDSFVSAGFKNNNTAREFGERREREKDFNAERGGERRERDFNDNNNRREQRDFKERPEREFWEREYREPPKKGNTIYVHGNGASVNEEMLRTFFASFGKILNVAMETDRNNAFITFETMESADKAISEANDAVVNHIKLRVQMARRQKPLETIVDAGASTSSWSSIAANTNQKGGPVQKGGRNLMTYDAGDMFD